MLQFRVRVLQVFLAATFIVIPVSRVFGAPALQQVLSLGVPLWLIWIGNVIELGGAVLRLLGICTGFLAAIGALLIASSLVGATVAHGRAANLVAEGPGTLIFCGLCFTAGVVQC